MIRGASSGESSFTVYQPIWPLPNVRRSSRYLSCSQNCGQIHAVFRIVVNAVDVELPRSAVNRRLQRNTVTHFPAETLCRACAYDGALAVAHELLPLVVWNGQLGKTSRCVSGSIAKLGKKFFAS